MTAAQVAHRTGMNPVHRGLVRAVAIAVAGLAVGAIAITGARVGDGGANGSAVPASTHALEAAPAQRLAVGAVALDGATAGVRDRLGRADHTGPDIDGRALTWQLDGVELTVTDRGGRIAAVGATIVGSGLRPQLDNGVVLGQSTLAQVLARWGEPTRRDAEASDDFVVAYDTCREGAPIVIKLDQADGRHGLDHPVTSVLLGYADEPAC